MSDAGDVDSAGFDVDEKQHGVSDYSEQRQHIDVEKLMEGVADDYGQDLFEDEGMTDADIEALIDEPLPEVSYDSITPARTEDDGVNTEK